MKAKALGVVFLVLLMAGIWASYAAFTKKFADYDEVTLVTDTTGLQLPQRADIKIRGMIVGEVTDVTTEADEARVTLGLFPDEIGEVPANVTAAILPKTLFGEKFVSLEVPGQAAPQAIEPGATIERSEVSIEVQKVLSDLYPLLRTIDPLQLNKTLTALSNALEGRGEQLGDNLETLDGYLKKINPQIPALVDDLRLASDVSDTYSDVLPQVAKILRDSIVTTGTLEDRSTQVRALFTDVARFAGFTRGFLNRNDENLIRVAQLSAKQLQVLARYAPEFPCLSSGIVKAGALQAEAFRGYTLHINLEVIPNQPRAYNQNDDPRYAANRPPHCGTLPSPPFNQQNPYQDPPDVDDGVDEPTGKGIQRAATGFDGRVAANGSVPGGVWTGSEAEADVLRSLLGPVLGVSDDEVDDLGVLLTAPLARGAEVELR